MVRKNPSIDRITRQFKGMDIAQISLIQAKHSLVKNTKGNRSKVYVELKQALGKPNIADFSAMAQGRLSNHYINMISNPTILEQKRITKKFKVDLESKNFAFNLVQLKNTRFKTTFKKTGIDDILDYDKDVDDWDGKKMDSGIIITELDRILSLRGTGYVQKTKKGYDTIIKYSKYNLMDFLNRIRLTSRDIGVLHSNGLYQFRVLMKIRYENTEEGWISTKNLQFSEYDKIELLFDDTHSYIVNSTPYEDDENEYVVFEKVLEIRVYWMN